MVTLGKTLAVPGTRRASGDSTAWTVCWAVASTLTTPDQGERVSWAVVSGSSIVALGTETARKVAAPNFSTYPSRMPQNRSGMALTECYSITLDLTTLPAGLLILVAEAFGHDGTSKVLDTDWIFNDTAGGDSRLSTKAIHCDVDIGSDGANGLTQGTAVATLGKAIDLAKAGTGGDPNNCGGATIFLYGDVVGNGGGSPGNWHTGPLQWLTIRCMPGMTWTRTNPPFSAGGDFIATGNGAGTNCRVRIQAYDVVGCGPIFAPQVDGQTGQPITYVELWREGGQHGSEYYDAGVNVLCLVDDNGCFDISPHLSGSSTNHKSYCTGELRLGSRIAYSAETLIFDCEVRGSLGGATYIQGPFQNACCHSLIASDHTYTRNVTPGWACNQADGFLPLDALEVTKSGSTMRILGPSAGTPIPFSTQAALLVGAPASIGLFLSGFTNGGNNGAFPVTAAGITGGRHYIEVTNAACVAEGPTAGALLETAFNGTRYNIVVHTSYISFGTSRTGQDIFRDIAHFDITEETQGAFGNGADHSGLLIDNVRGAGGFSNVNIQSSTVTNSIIRRCSWPASTLQVDGNPESWAGTQMTNCVFNSMGANTGAAIAAGLQMQYCHAVDGSTPVGATNHTTGAWLPSGVDPLESPFSIAPDVTRYGTGDPRIPNVAGWSFPAAQSTKGATPPITDLDWLQDTNDITGTAAGAVTIASTGSGEIGRRGTGAGVVTITSVGQGGIGLQGSGAGDVTLASFGTGFIGAAAPSVGATVPAISVREFTAGYGVAVVPSDTESFDVPAEGIRAGSSGTVMVRTRNGAEVAVVMPAGTFLPLRVAGVSATGTTSTGITAVY